METIWFDLWVDKMTLAKVLPRERKHCACGYIKESCWHSWLRQTEEIQNYGKDIKVLIPMQVCQRPSSYREVERSL